MNIWLKRFFGSMNPVTHGWKSAGKKLALLFVLIAVGSVAFKAMMQIVMMTLICVVAVMISVNTALPRWLVIWYQYRSILIEITFGGLASLMLRSTSLDAMMIIVCGAAFTTVAKVINMRRKKRVGSDGDTLYESMLKERTANGDMPEEIYYLTKADTPLRADYHYDRSLEGFGGWKFFMWSLLHHVEAKTVDDESGHDFFSPRAPRRSMGGFMKESFWGMTNRARRAEARADREERTLAWQFREARKKLLAELRQKLANLNDDSLLATRERGNLAGQILDLEKELL